MKLNHYIIINLSVLLMFCSPLWAADFAPNIEGVNRTLMETLSQIKTLQQELQELRGEVELHTHLLNTLKIRQQEILQNLDRRTEQRTESTPNNFHSSITNAPETSGLSTATPALNIVRPAATPAARQTPNNEIVASPEEQSAYDSAFNLLRSGGYDDAIKGFRNFIAEYPKGQLAANSQYWIGEAYYVTRRFKEALPEFQSVVDDYHDSVKISDALLKLGYIQYELNQINDARKSFEEVMTRFPQSTAAKLANARLAKMKR